MDNTKKKRIFLAVGIIIIVGSIIIAVFESKMSIPTLEMSVTDSDISSERQDVSQDIQVQSSDKVQIIENVEQVRDEIPIYICGAVNIPGIYFVDSGTYLFELVDNAGGFSEDAAAEYVNLVLILNASFSIYIPTRADLENLSSTPHDPAGVIIRASFDTYSWGHQPIDNQDHISGSSSGLININVASISELQTLPGIGSVTAQAIVTYRETHGYFDRIEDIMNVSGIKDSRFSAIRDFISTE